MPLFEWAASTTGVEEAEEEEREDDDDDDDGLGDAAAAARVAPHKTRCACHKGKYRWLLAVRHGRYIAIVPT